MMADFSKTAGDYSRHGAGFSEALVERISSEGDIHRGDAVLDLGRGTSAVAPGALIRTRR